MVMMRKLLILLAFLLSICAISTVINIGKLHFYYGALERDLERDLEDTNKYKN